MICPACNEGHLKFYKAGIAVCETCFEAYLTKDLVGSDRQAVIDFLTGNPKLIVVGFTQEEWQRAKERRKLYRGRAKRRRKSHR